MPKRVTAAVITLAILLPGIIAGTWVAYYLIHQKHSAPRGSGLGAQRPALVAFRSTPGTRHMHKYTYTYMVTGHALG